MRPQERTPLARLEEGAVHHILGYQLALAVIVTNQVFDETVGTPDGLRRVEFTMLSLIERNPGVNARQLARALAVTPPNIALWLDQMATRGLIVRERSASDARVQHVHLTPAGQACVEDCARRLRAAEEQALASLSPAERAMLVELLHKVALARRRPDHGN